MLSDVVTTFSTDFKGTPSARQPGPGWVRSGRKLRAARRASPARHPAAPAGVAGTTQSEGAAALPRPSGRQPSGHGGCRPGWQARTRRSREPAVTPRRPRLPNGPPVPLAPGMLSPRKDHSQGRACGASLAPQGQTLDSDLPRQDLGTYREGRGRVEVSCQWLTAGRPDASVSSER